MIIARIRALIGRRKAREREARQLKMELDRKAVQTADSIEKLNDVLRNSAAYRIAVAAGRKDV
jgi:hypothetical protein